MSQRRPRRPKSAHQPRLLAGWQRGLIWVVWLCFFGLCIANSDRGEFSLREFGVLILAGTITIACLNSPAGREKIVITDPAEMLGEFRSRTNWALVLFGAALLLVGVAAGFKIGHDLYHGLTTVGGVFEDFLQFFLEMFLERISRGVEGEVTRTKMYILIFLLPIGALVFWFNLTPWLFRGTPFRVGDDGQLSVLINHQWQALQLPDFRKVTADGFTIEFAEPLHAEKPLSLPLERVFSDRLGTRVASSVIAGYMRNKLEKSGFVVQLPLETGATKSFVAVLPSN